MHLRLYTALDSVLHVWDIFYCEGMKVIFHLALLLVQHTLGSVDWDPAGALASQALQDNYF